MSAAPSVQISQIEDIQLPLVNRFYKDCRYSAKAGRGEVVFVARVSEGQSLPANKIIAAVRFQKKADDWWFLRSMCVAPECRGQGVGQQLLAGLKTFLAERPCFCYPFNHLEAFYGLLGFELTETEQIHLQPSFMSEPFERYTRQGRKIILMQRPVDRPRS